MIMKKLLKKVIVEASPTQPAILEQVQVVGGLPPKSVYNKPNTDLARARTQHDAFLTMFNSGSFPIEQTIRNWWPVAFAEPFPSDCMFSLQECKVMIQYQLYRIGYRQAGVPEPEEFTKGYERYFSNVPTILRQCEQENELSRLYINKILTQSKEGQMTTKEKAVKVPSEKRVTPTGICMKMLYERKHTDEEILAEIAKQFPGDDVGKWLPRISINRSDVNAGRKGEAPAEPMERLYRIDGKLVKKSALPKTEKPAKKSKIDPENDPLKKIAGIDTSKKITTGKAPKPPAEKAAPAKKVITKK